MSAKARLSLSFVGTATDRVAAILDGTVEPEGIELIHTNSGMTEASWRVLKYREFQVQELPISCFFMAESLGLDLVGIPVFPRRTFMHTGFQYHVDSGITQPNDLAGKRVGMAEFQQTGSMWARGILEHDFGVAQASVAWFEQAERLSHGEVFYNPPPGVKVERVPTSKNLSAMLLSHDLDAARVGPPRNKADRDKVKPLFPDPVKEGIRFFADHGFIPANHIYAIRRDVHEEYPWVALNLYNAFVRAKDNSRGSLENRIPTDMVFGDEYMQQTRDTFGDDPFPYGFKANEKMLQICATYCQEQGLAQSSRPVESYFAPVTLSL
jgi:4,5-dihydroxyphthalate decarboxylase